MKCGWLRDALIVDKCPVETVEIGDRVAAISLSADLCVTPRDNSPCGLNGNIRSSIATEQGRVAIKHIFAAELSGRTTLADQNRRWLLDRWSRGCWGRVWRLAWYGLMFRPWLLNTRCFDGSLHRGFQARMRFSLGAQSGLRPRCFIIDECFRKGWGRCRCVIN